MFADKLIENIEKKNNSSVVGLDTRIEYVPPKLKTTNDDAQDILRYNSEIIDTISDIIPAVKIQSACYEALGTLGIETYKKTIEYAKKAGLTVIGDVKRGDIGSTAEEYAKAHFKVFGCDAITINPYMGMDTIEPFIKYCREYERGIFILIKTSNPGSSDFQNLDIGNKKLYEIVAQKVDEEAGKYIGKYGYSFIGGVVGATYPYEMEKVRRILKSSIILIPGYGAQGGTAEALKPGFKAGKGAIINASRSILLAHKNPAYTSLYGDDYKLCIRQEVIRMRDEINKNISQI